MPLSAERIEILERSATPSDHGFGTSQPIQSL